MEFLKHFFVRIIVLFCWGLLYALTFILLVWGLLGIDPFTAIEMMKKNIPQRREKIEALYDKVSNKELPAVPEKTAVPSAGIAVSLEEVSEVAQPAVPSELVPPPVNPQAEPAPEVVLDTFAEEPTEGVSEIPVPPVDQEKAEPLTAEETSEPAPLLSVVNVLTEDMAFDEETTERTPAENLPVMDIGEAVIDVQSPVEDIAEDKEEEFILPSQDIQLQE